MRRSIRLLLALPLLFALTRCSQLRDSLPPFETEPPPLLKSETEPVPRVAVCYNSLTATAERVREIAAVSCGPGTTPAPLSRDESLRNCPVLTPMRVTFACLNSPDQPR